MPDSVTVRLKGFREANIALAGVERSTRLQVRSDWRAVGEPVAAAATRNALGEIRRMPRSPRWSRMRVGLTRNVLYVAPRERGIKKRGDLRRRRPNLADLLMARAMEPALEREAPHIEAAVEQALDRIAARFNQGGAP